MSTDSTHCACCYKHDREHHAILEKILAIENEAGALAREVDFWKSLARERGQDIDKLITERDAP